MVDLTRLEKAVFCLFGAAVILWVAAVVAIMASGGPL